MDRPPTPPAGRDQKYACVQQVSHSSRLHQHTTLYRVSQEDVRQSKNKTYQAASKKHYRDGHVLQILDGPCLTPAGKMFEEDIGRAVEKDDERLDELCGGYGRLPRPDHARRGSHIPSPAEFGKTAHPTTESQ